MRADLAPTGNRLRQANMILHPKKGADGMDHDRLFKQLLTTFFVEFLELFFPEMVEYLDRETLEFLDKEVFTDVTGGERHEVDLMVKTRFRGQPSFFLVHVETQAQPQADFARRMFNYFARLHEKFALPVYPIALFSYDQATRTEPDQYRVEFPDLTVLAFRFRTVQLNRLDWHSFAVRMNPIAAALMARMHAEPADRARLMAACLALLAKLELDPARRELISGFIGAYLRLTMEEEQEFRAELNKLEPQRREYIMEIVTGWMEKGMEKGMDEGTKQGKRDLVLRLLRKRFGSLELDAEDRIDQLSGQQLDQLAEALLDFSALSDLTSWLDVHPAQ